MPKAIERANQHIDILHNTSVLLNGYCRTIKQHGKDSPEGKKAIADILTYRRIIIQALDSLNREYGEG